MKKILVPLIICFVGLFMVFIYEPIISYSANINDYWFDLNELVKTNVLFFCASLIGCILASLFIYYLTKKIKKDWIYYIFLVLLSSLLIISYIHGNYLSNSLPILDGSTISWGKYTTQNIISIAVVLVVMALNVFILIKFRKKYGTVLLFISFAIFFMLSSSLVVTLINSPEIYKFKGKYVSTIKDINVLSENKNFVILLIDMVDSKTFDKNIKLYEKEEVFKDFTYFPDTLSEYPFTRESIPFIFSGKRLESKQLIVDYYNKSFKDSNLVSMLKEQKYTINIYEPDINIVDDKINFNNVIVYNYDFNKMSFFRQELKYILFKYIPFPLKKYSRIETLDYNLSKSTRDTNIFYEDNKKVYDTLDDIKTQKNNYFQFLHIEGGHYPWNIDKDFNLKSPATYDDKVASSITVVEKYLDRIKKSGQYDNTAIMILADHGHNYDDYASAIGRQNPILYIKGINETHDEMQISEKKVSFEDLNDTIYKDLLDGKKSSDLLQNIDEDRIRYFLWFEAYDFIYEQSLDGFAWETDKLKNTGKIYER